MIDHARAALDDARLYLVCADLPDERLRGALRGGVDVVQLRMKTAAPPEIVRAGLRFARICAEHRVPFILNDHAELVTECGADGVHVGQDDMSVEQAREIAGPDRIVGLSTHRPAEIAAAAALAPDYIGVGPVHATPTKPGRRAVGTELVEYAAQHAAMPWFAIGGIDSSNIVAVVAAGARRIAVVRAIADASDPEAAARQLRTVLDAEVGVGAA